MKKLLVSLMIVCSQLSFADESPLEFVTAYSDFGVSVKISAYGASKQLLVYNTSNPDVVKFHQVNQFHQSGEFALSEQYMNCKTMVRQVLLVRLFDSNGRTIKYDPNPQQPFQGRDVIDRNVHTLVCSARRLTS